jgi:hypothetical protein
VRTDAPQALVSVHLAEERTRLEKDLAEAARKLREKVEAIASAS